MASKYFVGNGTNWSSTSSWSTSSGGASGAAVPAAGDDVIFDTNSPGNGTIDVNTNTIRSIVMTGFAHTLTHSAAVTLNIGGATAPVSNIALVFAGTYTISNATTSAISIADTSAATNTYNFNGATLGNVTINNGTTTITQLTTSGFSQGATATLTLTQGGLDFNGQSPTIGIFASTVGNTRTLKLSTGTISVIGAGTAWNVSNGTGLTVSSNTATIDLTNASTFSAGNLSYGGLTLNITAPGCTVGNMTLTNLTFNPSAATTNSLHFSSGSSITITGTLTLTGAAPPNRILLSANSVGIATTVTCNGTVTATYCDFRDITAAGTASWSLASITGGSGNCLGNSGITFTTGQTNYYKGSGSANFSVAGNWYLATNGGGGAGRVPLPQDTAIFDSNSGANTYTFDTQRFGTLTATGFTGTLSLSSLAVQTYGNITWMSGGTLTASQGLTFMGRSSQTITHNGQRYNSAYTLQAHGGTYTQQDAGSCNTFSAADGTWTANNQNMSAATFSNSATSTTPVTINMGSGTWTVANSVSGQTVWGFGTTTGLTLNCNTSTIKFSNSVAGSWTFSGGGLTYYNFTWADSTHTLNQAITIAGSNTFNNIYLQSYSTYTRTLTLTAGTTQTCTGTFPFTLVGASSSNQIVINSSSAGTAATLSAASGTVGASQISLQDNTATGGARYFAGLGSTIGTNVTGWNLGNAPSGGTLATLGVG